jgi:hypothetical protein
MVGIKIQYCLPVQQRFVRQIHLLKQHSQVATGTDISGADIQELL